MAAIKESEAIGKIERCRGHPRELAGAARWSAARPAVWAPVGAEVRGRCLLPARRASAAREPHAPSARTRLRIDELVLKRNQRIADKSGMAVLVNLALGGGLGVAIVIGFWLLVSLGDDLRREVRRSGGANNDHVSSRRVAIAFNLSRRASVLL